MNFPIPNHLILTSRHWYRDSIRRAHNGLRPKPVPKTATLFLRHPGLRPQRSHGALLSHDRLLDAVCRHGESPAASSAAHRRVRATELAEPVKRLDAEGSDPLLPF